MSVLKTTLLTALLFVPPAALLRASDPPTPPAPPEAPAPPDPPEAPRARRKKIVVTSPGKDIVVDGDRVFISGDDGDRDLMADLDGLGEDDGLSFALDRPGRGGRGFIGVLPIQMTPELRQHFGAPRDAGILVGSVEPDSPAAKAGLQVGDIVTKMDGGRIDSTGELVRTVRHKKSGEAITVEVLRNGAAKSLKVTVSEHKEKEVRVGELPEGFPGHGWGWKAPRPGRPMLAPLPPGAELEERLDELEKKLKELERRFPAR
jgi:hypothetical protein